MDKRVTHRRELRRWRWPWTEWCSCGLRWDQCLDAAEAKTQGTPERYPDRPSPKETRVRCPADQLRIRTDWPGRFTIGDQTGAILHILLPCRTTQNSLIARERLRELAMICGNAADAIFAEDA